MQFRYEGRDEHPEVFSDGLPAVGKPADYLEPIIETLKALAAMVRGLTCALVGMVVLTVVQWHSRGPFRRPFEGRAYRLSSRRHGLESHLDCFGRHQDPIRPRTQRMPMSSQAMPTRTQAMPTRTQAMRMPSQAIRPRTQRMPTTNPGDPPANPGDPPANPGAPLSP